MPAACQMILSLSSSTFRCSGSTFSLNTSFKGTQAWDFLPLSFFTLEACLRLGLLKFLTLFVTIYSKYFKASVTFCRFCKSGMEQGSITHILVNHCKQSFTPRILSKARSHWFAWVASPLNSIQLLISTIPFLVDSVQFEVNKLRSEFRKSSVCEQLAVDKW